MPVHSFETLAAMKKELMLLARVYASNKGDARFALDHGNMKRYETWTNQAHYVSFQIRAIARLYRTFLNENDAELNRMAITYGAQ
jgi:hypothetical protein